MKIFFVACLLATIISTIGEVRAKISKEFKEDIIKKLDVVEKCSDIFKQNENDIMSGGLRSVGNNKDDECWMSCVFQKMGIIIEGKPDWDLFKHYYLSDLNDDSYKAKADVVYELCKEKVIPVVEENDCKLANSMIACKEKYFYLL